jgi:hypothetical protein
VNGVRVNGSSDEWSMEQDGWCDGTKGRRGEAKEEAPVCFGESPAPAAQGLGLTGRMPRSGVAQRAEDT